MKICFVLPQILRKPIGGYKIAFEYANRLQDEGEDVSILFLNDEALQRFGLPKTFRYIAIEVVTKIEPKWFKLNPKIKKYTSTQRNIEKKLENIDIAIATGAGTVDETYQYFPKARKAYLIQGYETWFFDIERLNRTFACGMDNIVIAKWLKKIVDQYSPKPSILISNPIDVKCYYCSIPICKRNKYTLGVLYHTVEVKGFKYAYEALLEVKKKIPELKVKMFGTSKPDWNLPRWIEFTLNASQKETVDIYNEISIFVCATIEEGFGLTGLEAMACGAALVSTSYEGVKEYAVDKVNCLLSPVCNSGKLAENIEYLIRNDEKRMKLAMNGVKMAQDHSWENAMNIFRRYIQSVK